MLLEFILFELFWFTAFILALIHSIKIKGWEKTTIFFFPVTLWGWLLEFATVEIFHRYLYSSNFFVFLFSVPLAISLGWATIIYFSHYFVSEKLKIKSIIKLVLLSAVCGVLFDLLFLEPLAFTFHYWTWTPESIWFGSPIGNVIGWFFAIVLFLFNYSLITQKFRGTKKQFIFVLASLIVNVIVLEIILKIWTIFFGTA